MNQKKCVLCTLQTYLRNQTTLITNCITTYQIMMVRHFEFLSEFYHFQFLSTLDVLKINSVIIPLLSSSPICISIDIPNSRSFPSDDIFSIHWLLPSSIRANITLRHNVTTISIVRNNSE